MNHNHQWKLIIYLQDRRPSPLIIRGRLTAANITLAINSLIHVVKTREAKYKI